MKIIKSEIQNDKIFVSAELDGETRNYHFEQDQSADEIKEELNKCEAVIKARKKRNIANAKLDAANEKASKTVELLTKKQ